MVVMPSNNTGATVRSLADRFPGRLAHLIAPGGWRVHVGRVNQPARLEFLEDLGVESCDGTGWLRGDQMQLSGLVGFLSGHRNLRLFETLEELPPIAEGVKA